MKNNQKIYKWAQGKYAIKLLEKEGGKNIKDWTESENNELFYMPFSGGIIEWTNPKWSKQCDYIRLNGAEIISNKILTRSERKYLRDVIRPFRNRVLKVRKTKSSFFHNEEYIEFLLDDDSFNLPNLKIGEAYEGMESNKSYTLEELEL